MIEQAQYISSMLYIMILGRLGWLWVKGTIDKKSAMRAVEIFAALAVGTTVAGIVAKTAPALGAGTGFTCRKYSSIFSDCAGWPILGTWFAPFVGSMLSWIQAGAGIPASAAPLLGNAYVAKKMSEGNMDVGDILRAFFTGAAVFFILVRLDLVIDSFNAAINQFSWLSARVEEGKDIMARWSQNVDQYGNYAADNLSWYNPDAWLLGFGHGCLSFVVNFGSTLFAFVQCLILIFVPMAAFRGLLYDKADMWAAVRLTATFGTLMFFNNIVWTMISWFPSVKPPNRYGDEILLGDSAWKIMTSMLGAATIIFIFYLVVGFLCYFIVKKAIVGDE